MRVYGSGYGNVPRPVPTLERSPDWHSRAACRGYGDDTWFPIGSTGPAAAQIAEAKTICQTLCPVVAECLAYALARGIDEGVWGGKSTNERRAMVGRGPRRASRLAQAAQPSSEVKERGQEMLRLGWSQHDVATHLQVSKNMVTSWAKQLHEEVDAL